MAYFQVLADVSYDLLVFSLPVACITISVLVRIRLKDELIGVIYPWIPKGALGAWSHCDVTKSHVTL